MALVLVASAWSQSVDNASKTRKDDPESHYVFRIPVFPGTELFKSSPVLAELSTPIATTLEVYVAKDGKSLSKEAVLAYYRDELSKQGWKDGIFKGQASEPYLSMRAEVFDNLEDGSRIQVAGEFFLWVAPRDGMITVYLKQWRISSVDQVSLNSKQTIIKRLTDTASKLGYRAEKAASDGGWRKDFENEYLVERTVYSLVPKGTKTSMDAPPGTLIVTLLTYRDANVALAEKTVREQQHKIDASSYDIGLKGKTLISVEGDVAKEKLASILGGVLTF